MLQLDCTNIRMKLFFFFKQIQTLPSITLVYISITPYILQVNHFFNKTKSCSTNLLITSMKHSLILNINVMGVRSTIKALLSFIFHYNLYLHSLSIGINATDVKSSETTLILTWPLFLLDLLSKGGCPVPVKGCAFIIIMRNLILYTTRYRRLILRFCRNNGKTLIIKGSKFKNNFFLNFRFLWETSWTAFQNSFSLTLTLISFQQTNLKT